MILVMTAGMACYHGNGLSPDPGTEDVSGIQGRVTFTGVWPDSTKEVRVAAMKHYPDGITDPDSLMTFVFNAYMKEELVFSDTLQRFVRETEYRLALNPDIYAWVLVAWFPDIPDYLTGVKELGAFYRDPDDTETPSPVVVIPGVMTPDIDIVADLGYVERTVPFFKQKMTQ